MSVISWAWEQVQADLKSQEQQGSLDIARMQTLAVNIDKAKGRIPEAIKQAYCIVVTVSDKDDIQAFKINVTDEAHFTIIKNDDRSRIQESAIEADALLPSGPYNLWQPGETSRRVKRPIWRFRSNTAIAQDAQGPSHIGNAY